MRPITPYVEGHWLIIRVFQDHLTQVQARRSRTVCATRLDGQRLSVPALSGYPRCNFDDFWQLFDKGYGGRLGTCFINASSDIGSSGAAFEPLPRTLMSLLTHYIPLHSSHLTISTLRLTLRRDVAVLTTSQCSAMRCICGNIGAFFT